MHKLSQFISECSPEKISIFLRQMQHSFPIVQVRLTNSLFSNKIILVPGERTQYSVKGSSPKHSLMHVCADSIYTNN